MINIEVFGFFISFGISIINLLFDGIIDHAEIDTMLCIDIQRIKIEIH